MQLPWLCARLIFLILGVVPMAARAEVPFRITWSLGPPMPQYRKGGIAGVVDGHVIYAGGMQNPWREPDDVLAYDPQTRRWEFITPMPANPSYTSGTSAGDVLYVLGGRNADGRCFRLTHEGGQWVWTELPSLNQPRVGAVVAVVGDLLIAASGGWGMKLGGFDSTPVSTVEALDLTNVEASWQTLPHYPGFRRSGAMGAVCGGKFHMFGGYRRLERGVQADDGFVGVEREGNFADAFCYDPATEAWEKIPDMPHALEGGFPVPYADRYIIMLGGAGYITTKFTFDGEEIGGYSDEVLVYDTATGGYSTLEDRMPAGLNDIKACIIGDTIYAIGGESSDPRTSNTVNLLQIGRVEKG